MSYININRLVRNRAIALLFLVFLGLFISGCGKDNTKLQALIDNDGKYHIICSTFPLYDWTRNIVGNNSDRISVSLLVDDGCDVHSYQATAVDVAAISSCDLLIFAGGESEKWVKEAALGAENKEQIVLELLDVLGDKALEEDASQIIMAEEEHSHDDEEKGNHDEAHDVNHNEAYDEDHDLEYDEHIWLSLKNAMLLCQEIKNAVTKLDANNAAIYESNYTDYAEKLMLLESLYERALEGKSDKTVLFADRFPFRYLFEDYNLTYYAAFSGCSAETEASFEVITSLAGKMDLEKISSVMILEKSSDKIANTVIASSNQKDSKVLVMDSMQSVSRSDMLSGVNYLDVMKNNLETLKLALD